MQVVAKVFESLSDNVSLGLFTTIAHESINSVVLRNKVKITRKQYYSRLSKMMKAGLIKRNNGKLVVTAFGKIVYKVQETVENARQQSMEAKGNRFYRTFRRASRRGTQTAPREFDR